MMLISTQNARLYEIMRFCLVGGASFLLDFSLLYIFTEYVGLSYLYSAGLSFSISVVFNYWLCVTYVFTQAKKQTARQAFIFMASSLIGLGLNQLCMWFFVEIMALYYMWAKIGATIIVTVWNYVIKRKAVQI